MKPIITAKEVSKQYRLGAHQSAHQSLRAAVRETLGSPLKRLRRHRADSIGEILWALKDVSFEVEHGEVLGLIGHNGAGKSTLLKILSRITEPTSGKIELYGRLASLLEVGTGFQVELTGRENVALNGAILGMRKVDIDRKFDEIVAFAEVEKFIDTPVKYYSSGMYVRLAFAVAAHLEPEILVIDEVLAVGDMAFQQKCLDKITDLKKQAKAIILVSHNMISIRAICSRVILLDHGQIAAAGDADSVVPLYEKIMLEDIQASKLLDEEGIGLIQVNGLRLLDEHDVEKQVFELGEKMKVRVEYEAPEKAEGTIVYAAIRRPDGFICVATSTKLEDLSLPPLEGSGVIEVEIPEVLVMPGHYVMDVTFYDRNFEFRTYFLGRKRIAFEVSSRLPSLDEKYGVVYQQQKWNIALINKKNTALT